MTHRVGTFSIYDPEGRDIYSMTLRVGTFTIYDPEGWGHDIKMTLMARPVTLILSLRANVHPTTVTLILTLVARDICYMTLRVGTFLYDP